MYIIPCVLGLFSFSLHVSTIVIILLAVLLFPSSWLPCFLFHAIAAAVMQAALVMRDQLGHAGDRHAHQAVAPVGGRANVQRPRQEALQLELHGRA